MKKFFVFLFFVFLTISPFSLAKEAKKGELINVSTRGIVCSFCAKGVKKHFSKVDGVKEVKVDIESGEVKIKKVGGVFLGDKEVRNLVEKAGFEVDKISRFRERD